MPAFASFKKPVGKHFRLETARMCCVMSFIGIVGGSAAAYFAHRFPAHMEAIETGAGVLLIGGLMLLGAGLPAVL
jgi:hypothetical protein